MEPLNLYLLTQCVNNDYDTYDSIVVCAENEESAKRISPDDYHTVDENDHFIINYSNGTKSDKGLSLHTWCRVEDIQVQYLGKADELLKKGVILASFNAG